MMGELLDRRGRPRVAVTGTGLRTPAGHGLAEFWAALIRGHSVAAPITSFDASDLPVRFACEIRDFDPTDVLSAREARRLDRAVQLGYSAACTAVDDAGLGTLDPATVGVFVGTGIGGFGSVLDQVAVFAERGPRKVSPFMVPSIMPNALSSLVGIHHGWTGPNLTITTACAAGAHALVEAARYLRAGDVRVAVAGGTESILRPMGVAGFARAGALSTRNDDPTQASRPFDAERDGFVMGEGAGFLVLERLDDALARGARVCVELVGVGSNSDAHHITAPSPGGAGAAACMELALEDAGLGRADIGHVNAHGTSTPLNDANEAEAIAKVFGELRPAITSSKGVLGHLVGASGSVEAIATALAVRDGVVPPTANHRNSEPEMPDIDVVSSTGRAIGPAPALSNSFGFGGHNATLVFAPVEV